MDNFASQVLSEMNKFRTLPTSVAKRLEVFRRGLSRLKSTDPFLHEIDSFVAQLPEIEPLTPFEMNEKLSEIASTQLPLFTMDPDSYVNFQRAEDLVKILPKIYMKEDPVLIVDDSSDKPEDVVNRLMLNKGDKFKIGRGVLMDSQYTQVGIAHCSKEDDNFVVIIFAHKKARPRSEMPLPEGDLTELKQAFDLFDVKHEEEISPKETLEAMKNLGYDKKNPELYRIMMELDTPENETVDFPLFANHIIRHITDKRTLPGIRTIFNLFVDDFRNDTISILNLKKIIEELGESVAQDEINRLLEIKGSANAKLNFEEFLDFMRRVYALTDEDLNVKANNSFSSPNEKYSTRSFRSNNYKTQEKVVITKTTRTTTTYKSGGVERTNKTTRVQSRYEGKI